MAHLRPVAQASRKSLASRKKQANSDSLRAIVGSDSRSNAAFHHSLEAREQMDMPKRPLVCTETLRALQESLDGEKDSCRNFVSRYVEMWPGRFERISAAVASGDNDLAMDSALSLRSSSLMVGAARLSALTDELIRLLEGRHASAARRKLASIQACGNETAGKLSATCVTADGQKEGP